MTKLQMQILYNDLKAKHNNYVVAKEASDNEFKEEIKKLKLDLARKDITLNNAYKIIRKTNEEL